MNKRLPTSNRKSLAFKKIGGNWKDDINFNQLTKKIWEELYSKYRNYYIEKNYLDSIGKNFFNTFYPFNTPDTGVGLDHLEREYHFYFLLYHNIIRKIQSSKNSSIKINNPSFYTYGEIYEEKMHVDNETAKFSPQKEAVKNTPLHLDIQETERSPSPQPVEVPITKVELLSEPPIPLPIVIPPPNKPVTIEKITEPKNIPIISIDEIKEKIANDPLYNAILLFITKFMYSEEAMDNLKLILKEDIYDILVQIKNKSYVQTNLNLILYSTDYFQLILNIGDIPNKFQIKKQYMNCIK